MIQDEHMRDRFERRARRFERRSAKGRIFTGLVLLAVGAILLIQKLSAPFPQWFFTWPVVMIALGLFIGIRKKFRGPGWLMFLLIGGLFLTADLHPEWNIRMYTWPIVLIFIGLAFIFRPRHKSFNEKFSNWAGCDDWDEKKNPGSFNTSNDAAPEPGSEAPLEIVSILGGTKKVILSKDFKGGEVTSFLGGTELNLSQADINGRVTLELTQVLGGTKLIVPAHWDIQPELVSFLGGLEDKRHTTGVVDPTKILILKGTSVFGGIEIRNF